VASSAPLFRKAEEEERRTGNRVPSVCVYTNTGLQGLKTLQTKCFSIRKTQVQSTKHLSTRPLGLADLFLSLDKNRKKAGLPVIPSLGEENATNCFTVWKLCRPSVFLLEKHRYRVLRLNQSNLAKPERSKKKSKQFHHLNYWGGRIRTYEWRYQKPMPYHLATPQKLEKINLLVLFVFLKYKKGANLV
jgi:hypothetical protein